MAGMVDVYISERGVHPLGKIEADAALTEAFGICCKIFEWPAKCLACKPASGFYLADSALGKVREL